MTTPGGKISAASINSKIRAEVSGSLSDGLSTNVLPQATANGRNQSGIIAGKLNGVIAAITPTGWRTISTSSPVATPSRLSPLSMCGAAHAASVDSIPRPTSPAASASVLPMSVVTSRASSSRWASSRSRSANTARARCSGEVARQAGKASRAALTVASTSAEPDSGTCANRSPVAGLRVSSVSPAAGAVQAPAT